MMRLIYLDPALTDIEGILDFISNDNPTAAVRFGEGPAQNVSLAGN